jgi:hypothetical protein
MRYQPNRARLNLNIQNTKNRYSLQMKIMCPIQKNRLYQCQSRFLKPVWLMSMKRKQKLVGSKISNVFSYKSKRGYESNIYKLSLKSAIILYNSSLFSINRCFLSVFPENKSAIIVPTQALPSNSQ